MSDAVSRLVEIVGRLRGPGGCPWDREQTLESLKIYLLEESFEVRDALDRSDPRALREELGDLLFQIVFQSRIAEEQGWFDLDSVASGIEEKLIRRHPHVFSGKHLTTSKEVVRQWGELKEAERGRDPASSRLQGVPPGLPALLRALRLSEKAARVGFDWTDARAVFDKVREEIAEWEEATTRGDAGEAARELGDLLFSLVNVVRKLGLEPEAALQSANERFARRFARMEMEISRRGSRPEALTAGDWESLWQEAKRGEEPG